MSLPLKIIVQRYITRHLKPEASKDLQKIVSRLASTTETRFINVLDNWYSKDEEFLNEKSVNPTTGQEYFTHRELIAVYRSLGRNLPYLFTCKNYSEFQIPNTTNSLDCGVFSQLKKLTKIHQGISKGLIDDYFVNYNNKLCFSLADFFIASNAITKHKTIPHEAKTWQSEAETSHWIIKKEFYDYVQAPDIGNLIKKFRACQ